MVNENLRSMIQGTELLPRQTGMFYLGQVGFLFKFRGKYILVDPYLTDYVDRNFSTEAVHWERRYPAPIRPEEVDFADLVLCTHPHADHADPETLTAIAKASGKAIFAGPASVRAAYRSYGIPEERICCLTIDEEKEFFEDIRVTMIPAAHEELHPDGHGGYEETGYILNLGGRRIFHSGDCCPYEGLEKRIMNCDVLMMPVNGRDYYRRYEKDIIGCFEPAEAAIIASRTNAGLLVPMHIDLYDVNALNPAIFVDILQTYSEKQRFHLFMPGELYILP